jgi:hypothetical protein
VQQMLEGESRLELWMRVRDAETER